jgi:hypothetical protein
VSFARVGLSKAAINRRSPKLFWTAAIDRRFGYALSRINAGGSGCNDLAARSRIFSGQALHSRWARLLPIR